MRRIGLQLVREKQRVVWEEKASGGGTALENGKDKGPLSLSIKASMDMGLPPEQQFSVEQILNQIPAFLVAGVRLTFYICSDSPARTDHHPSPLPIYVSGLRDDLDLDHMAALRPRLPP